jgi:hypothetical protein
MRRFFLLLLLPVSLFAAGHDLTTSFRSAPSGSPSDVPTVAFNSNHFLTLWPMASNIYGALADPASGPMPPAFPVLPFANPTALKVTAAGSGYLAVWNQQDVPYLGTLTSEGVLDRIVNLDAGRLMDPRIAFNGKTILVVDPTLNGSLPAKIVASLYDLDGHAITRYTLPVAAEDSYDVTNANGEFVVVTAGISGVNEWRVANDGTVLSTLQIDPPPANPNARSYNGSVAWKNGRIAVAWMQPQGTTIFSLAAIQPDGSITRVTLLERVTAYGITVLPVDNGFVLAWNVGPTPSAKGAVFAIRLDLSGVILDQEPVNLGGDGRFLSAASSGKAIEFALFTSSDSTPVTLIVTVGANGFSPLSAAPTAVTQVRQLLPVVSGNFAGFSAAWIERAAGVRNVAISRVAHDGQPLDGPGIALEEKSASSAAIAQGASAALVVWTDNLSVLATRMTPFGVRLDTTPILVGKLPHPEQVVSVAWNGSRYFVVWSTGEQLQSAFVDFDGIVTPAKALVNRTDPSDFISVPDVTWDGRQFIVVIGEEAQVGRGCGLCPIPIPDYIRVLRVSSAGDVIDATRIPGNYLRAHVASSGNESLITLESYHDVSTVVVHDEDGALQVDPPVRLFRWPVSVVSSDVTWDGSSYIVAWEYLSMLGAPSPGWLAAARLTQSGLPFASFVAPVGAPESVIDSQSWGPSLAANDAREAGIAISETLPQSYVPRARLYLMPELAPMPPPPPAPRNAVSLFTGRTALIEWKGDDVPGYLVERSNDFGATWTLYAVLPGTARSITVPASIGNLFRISAFGPGGVSAAAITSIGSEPHRRAIRH